MANLLKIIIIIIFNKLMLKNEPKNLKIKNRYINSEIVKVKEKKNSSYQKDRHILLNVPKTNAKSASSNHISLSMEEDTKSKSSCLIPRIKQKQKDKNVSTKKKKKSKISKLKNEKLKIPTGKRRSISGQTSNLIINSFKNELKSFTPPKITKPQNIRRDKYGTEINKINKKKVHITFIDYISPNGITETIHIQSFKHLNKIEVFPNEQRDSSKCCIIV
jgi:hypothetical protein